MTFDENETTTENQTSYQPAPRDLLLLEVPIGVKVSPGATKVAIHVRTTNWKENRYFVDSHAEANQTILCCHIM